MKRRNFLKLFAMAATATGTATVINADTDVTVIEPISNLPNVLDATGLTVKEYQAITTLLLVNHKDVNVLSWELGLIPKPTNAMYCVGDVKYNGNYYFVNYYVERNEGYNDRIILTSVGKSRHRFYDKAEGNRFVESGTNG